MNSRPIRILSHRLRFQNRQLTMRTTKNSHRRPTTKPSHQSHRLNRRRQDRRISYMHLLRPLYKRNMIIHRDTYIISSRVRSARYNRGVIRRHSRNIRIHTIHKRSSKPLPDTNSINSYYIRTILKPPNSHRTNSNNHRDTDNNRTRTTNTTNRRSPRTVRNKELKPKLRPQTRNMTSPTRATSRNNFRNHISRSRAFRTAYFVEATTTGPHQTHSPVVIGTEQEGKSGKQHAPFDTESTS